MHPGQVIYSELSRPSNPQGNITLKGKLFSCRKTLPIDEMVILYDLQLNQCRKVQGASCISLLLAHLHRPL